MESRAVMILAIIISICHKIDAKLNVIPRDTEVKINDSTFMNCSTSLQADLVQWLHGSNHVYTGIAILEPYNDGRFSVEINASTGACNLVIRSIRPSDAGKYECVEDEGVGDRRSVQLIVLDADPICTSNMHSEGVIGPNSCGMQSDVVQLSCSVTYHGNVPPILQWKSSGHNQSVADDLSKVTFNNNEVTYKLTMNSTLDLNNASFICESTRTSDRQYSCSSDIIKIMYVFSSKATINVTTNDEVSCFANTSQSCSYNWMWYSGYDWIALHNDQTLKPTKIGWHRCDATCSIRNKSCTVESMHANVHSDSINEMHSDSGLLVVVVIVVICYWRKKQLKLKREEQEEQRLIELKRKREEQEEQRLIDGLPEIYMYKSDPAFVTTISPKTIGKEKEEIRGLTILDKELFVVCKLSSSVEVYNSMEFSLRREWNLPESFCAQDMVSCSTNKCLYINGYIDKSQPSEILRVDPNGQLIKNWSTKDDWGWGLSVTDESNVILTVFKKNKLNEYSPDGKSIREINLSSDADISYPWHTIKLKNRHFVVTHGHYKNDDLHRVCLVDAGGNFKKSYAEKRGLAIGQMDRPVYLSVDGHGFVMVVDRGNSRVLLLDSNLKLKGKILSEKGKHGLRDPCRILLDESNGRLFVADNESNNQRISVFNLRKDERGNID